MTRSLFTTAIAFAAGVAVANPDPAAAQPSTEQDTTRSQPHTAPSQQAHKSLEELLPDVQIPDLWIGSDAPKLTLSHFVRGELIETFEPGRVHIVEFWATWCGPCVAAFPHLSSLQEKHADQLRVIGVNIWEGSDGEDRVEEIESFVAEHPEMKYTVAIEQGTSMAENWMKASGRDGIPSAFIVDGQGKVMWMGHPLAIDEPLDQIINGGYDQAAVSAKKWQGHLTSVAYSQMLISAHEKDTARLFEVCKTLVYDAYNRSAMPLNTIAWKLLEYEEANAEIYRLARDAAERSCELTDWADWMILDTYALAMFKTGDPDAAIKWQKKAMELAPERHKSELQPQLDLFLGEG